MSAPSSNSASDSVSRREAIIDIAAEKFATLGFHGVSMRDIARENESSVATLYNHFQSKDALMLAIGARFYAGFIKELSDAATSAGDGLSRLVRMLRVAYQVSRRDRDEYLALSHDTRHVARTLGLEPLVEWRNQCIQIWVDVLREGAEDGSVQPPADPLSCVRIIFGALTGIIAQPRAQSFVASEGGDAIDTLCALLSEGLRPRSAPEGASAAGA